MLFITQGKTNWKYILIVVILAVIVGGGILWCTTREKRLITQLPKIEKPEKIEDETANWKTYRNERFGYEFKYPKDFTLQISGRSPQHRPYDEHATLSKENVEGKFFIDVYLGRRESARELAEPFKKEYGPIESFMINEAEGIKVSGENVLGHKETRIFIVDNGRRYDIWFYGNEENIKFYNKIVSTFKLIEIPTEFIEAERRYSSIIDKVLPPNFDRENTDYFIDDLDSDGKSEIIITVAQSWNGYLTIVTLLDEEGNYEKIGDFEYEGADRGIPTVKEVQDIDNDNQKEIFLNLAFGGASTSAEGILDVDFSNKKLDWVKFQDERGNIKEAIFYVGAAVMHQHDYTIEDLDKDGQKEVIEEDRWGEYKKPDKLEPWEKLVPMEEVEGMWWRYEVRVYEWDGLIFSYNEELSKERLSMINSE